MTSDNMFIYLICFICVTEINWRQIYGPTTSELHMTDSEINVFSLFPCLPSEGQLVMRYSTIDRDALLSVGATENLSKLK